MMYLSSFEQILPLWLDLLERSFLSEDLKTQYKKIMEHRFSRLS